MATESERAELARLAGGSSPLVRVIEVPKLAEVLVPLLPRATAAIRDWDDRVEVWRKSIFFTDGRRGGILAAAAPAPAVVPQQPSTTIINTNTQQLFTGAAPPIAPGDPTKAALFYPDGGGPTQQWSVPDQAWV